MWVMVEEEMLWILTNCCLSVKKSWSQSQVDEFRTVVLSLATSVCGTTVLKADVKLMKRRRGI